MDDEEVPVHGDQHDGEGGEEDAAGLCRPNQLAQYFLQSVISVNSNEALKVSTKKSTKNFSLQFFFSYFLKRK